MRWPRTRRTGTRRRRRWPRPARARSGGRDGRSWPYAPRRTAPFVGRAARCNGGRRGPRARSAADARARTPSSPTRRRNSAAPRRRRSHVGPAQEMRSVNGMPSQSHSQHRCGSSASAWLARSGRRPAARRGWCGVRHLWRLRRSRSLSCRSGNREARRRASQLGHAEGGVVEGHDLDRQLLLAGWGVATSTAPACGLSSPSPTPAHSAAPGPFHPRANRDSLVGGSSGAERAARAR